MSVLSLGAARTGVITIAAASALALLALPSAAHAAEVVTCTQQATADTEPWLTFSQSTNYYESVSAALGTFIGATENLPASLPASFTEDDLTDFTDRLAAANTALQASVGSLGGDNPIAALEDQLTAADPENTTGWKEELEALEDELSDQLSGIGGNVLGAFTTFNTALNEFTDAAEAAVQADVPEGGPYERPELPTTLTSDGAIVVDGYNTAAGLYQSILLDGAAGLVVYEDVCVTTTVHDAAPAVATATPAKTLAATGTSDGIALGTAAGLLLLAGAAVTVVSMRRRSA